MKNIRFTTILRFFSFVILLSLLSCTDHNSNNSIIPKNIRTLVLSEGEFSRGTGSISILTHDHVVLNDVFRKTNKRPLGDVPQSIKKIGENYYVPVNNSRKIEVIDAETFESVETMLINFSIIPMFVEHLGGDSIVVTDQSSAAIAGAPNTSSLTIMDINHGVDRDYVRRRIKIDNPTFGVKLVGNKLFVVSATLLVFDLDNLDRESMREVKDNDGKTFQMSDFTEINIDKNGMMWVLTLDGIKCIDPTLEKVVKDFPIKNINYRISRLVIDSSGENLYYNLNNSVFSLRIDDENISNEPLFTHSYDDSNWTTYGLDISNGNTIFISRVVFGSTTRSRIYEYGLDGKIVSKYKNKDGEIENFFRAGIFSSYFYFINEN